MAALASPRLLHDPDQGERVIAELLRTGRLRRAPAQPAPRTRPAPGTGPLSSGLPALDAALGGGLHRGELCELLAPPSAGGTALLCAALTAAARGGEGCALVDPFDAFDPRGAALGGLELRRLLWVRPGTLAQALRACELLLEARFALVALDLGALPAAAAGRARSAGERAERIDGAGRHIELVRFTRKAERPGPSPWARLGRRAERHRGALLVLSREQQAGSFAAATVELLRRKARWEGAPDTPGRLLRGATAQAQVVRSRHAPPSGLLQLHLPWSEPPAPEDQSPPGSARLGPEGGATRRSSSAREGR